MKLTAAQNRVIVDTPTEIILYNLQNNPISESSFIRFGDKNKINAGIRSLYLSKTEGKSLDYFAKNVLSDDLSRYDEQTRIELTIDTMIKFDSRKKINDYFSKKLKEQKTVKIPDAIVKKTINATDRPCLVKSSLKHMSKENLRRELNSFLESPKYYFGPLLEVDECKVYLFNLPLNKQIETAKAMLKQLDEQSPKPKYSIGKQQNVNLNYGDVLKAQKPYTSLKSHKTNTEPMATKPKAKKAKTATKKKTASKPKAKATPKKRVIKSAKVKKANKIFAEIPDMIVTKAYEAGKQGKSKPTYKKVWHDSYDQLKKK